jgi:transglutaminase-like putative cysteine protease
VKRKILLSLLLASLIVSCVPYPTVSASENYRLLLFDETVTVLDSRTVQVLLNYKFMPLLEKGYYFNTWSMYIHTADAFGITIEGENASLHFKPIVEGNWTRLDIDLGRKVYTNQSCLLKISYFATDRMEAKGPEKTLRMRTVTDRVYKDNVTLTVNIPKGYGLIEYEPPFLSSRESADGAVLSSHRLGVGADESYYLSVKFADPVVQYDVIYRYTFTNKGSTTERTPKFEVPGPLEVGRQEVSQISYSPSPISTSYDESGNLRSKFRTSPIAPGRNTTINIRFVAKITLPPAINDSYSGRLSEIPLNLMKYTTADTYWEVDDPTMRDLSQNLTKSETSVLNKVKAVYNFVIDNIEYDDAKFKAILSGQKPGRYGAIRTHTLGSGVCEDFSDLFVTLCRASGIPAMVVNGYTYDGDEPTSHPETGHAWAEVFIPRYGWLQVDPTWKLFGRLEGRHITSLLRKDSSEPKVIWWWVQKTPSYEWKCDITFLATEEIYRPDLSVSVSYEAETDIHRDLNLRLALSNHGNGTAYVTNVTVAVPERLVLLNRSLYSLGKLRGYESKDLNLVFNTTSLGNATIGVTVKYQAEGGGVETRKYNYSIVVIKALTVISCSVSPSNITTGNNVMIQGLISPARPGKNVTLTYIRPDEIIFTRTVITGSDGSYNDAFTPDTVGSWNVKANWEGDSTHADATSQSTSFTVEEKLGVGGIPGFPYESIILGLLLGVFILWMLQRRR